MGVKKERKERNCDKNDKEEINNTSTSAKDSEKKKKKKPAEKSRKSTKSSNGKHSVDSPTKASRRSSRRSESKSKVSGGASKSDQTRSLSKSCSTLMPLEKGSNSSSLSSRSTMSSRKSLPTSISFSSIPSHVTQSSADTRSSRKSHSTKSGSISSSSSGGKSSRESLSTTVSSSKALSKQGRRRSENIIGMPQSSETKSSASRGSSRRRHSSADALFLESSSETTKKTQKIRCSLCNKAEAAMSGLCHHKFCARCFTNVVYKPLEYPSTIVNNDHSEAPNNKIGRCPKCRLEVRKDQVRLCKDHRVTPRLPGAADDKQKVKDSSIAGKRFIPKYKDPKFCFDEDQPYIDLKEARDADKVNWALNDGSPVPDRVVFEDGCFFDEESRTFHGMIKWPVTIRGAYQWDVVLSFKEGCNVMHVGIIHERKERVLDEAYFKGASEEEIVRLQYPLDGTWKLTWKNVDNEEKMVKLTVRNNEFRQGRCLFNLDMSDPQRVFYRWPEEDAATTQATSDLNLIDNPMGPEIGEVVSWKASHPGFLEGFTWERLTFGEMPVQGALHFGVGSNVYVGRNGKELDSNSKSSRSSYKSCLKLRNTKYPVAQTQAGTCHLRRNLH